MLEENAKVSQFSSFDTLKFEGFDERILAELEEMVANFYKLPKVQALEKFFMELHHHLYDDKAAHNLDVSAWAEDILDQFTFLAKAAGFTGDRAQLMQAIAKLVEVGTHADHVLGASTEKATNVPGWRYLFNKHSADYFAHEGSFEKLVPTESYLNLAPTFFFTAHYPQDYEVYKGHGYTLTDWDPMEGTLFIDFHAYSPDKVYASDLFSLKYVDRDLTVKYRYDTTNKSGVMLYTRVNGQLSEPIITVPLPFDKIGRERIVFTWKKDLLQIKSFTQNVTTNRPLGRRVPVAITLDAPLAKSGVAIREISHYLPCISQAEQDFLLN